MTDDELIDNLRIVLIASRGSTGRGLRAQLSTLITTTTLHTCFDEAVERAGRQGDDELFLRLVKARDAIREGQDGWRSAMLEALPDISWLNAEGNNE